MSMLSNAVVIGASAGALDALNQVISQLPSNFTLPVFIVVHVPSDKPSLLPELLQTRTALLVKEAEDKEEIQGGTIYLAPPDYHLLIEENGHLSLSSDEPVLYSRPSIDVLFETAADAYRAGLTAIILTGANEDGAAGMKAVIAQGGVALVQHPHQAYASAMPQAVLERCPEAQAMSLTELSEWLSKEVIAA
jgi:two-component system chemotaxis response regulator CheB